MLCYWSTKSGEFMPVKLHGGILLCMVISASTANYCGISVLILTNSDIDVCITLLK